VNQRPPETETLRAITGWQLKLAEVPQIAEVPGTDAAQVGTEAKTFSLPLLEGGEFILDKQQGKVVVLDFWASWCAPCLKALPELMEALKAMPSDQVHLIGVNQGEPAPHVRTFLTTRRWNLTTVLDVDQAVGKAFGVEGIPHTVVIGPDGKVALVKTGYSAAAAGEIVAKVRELLKEK
jgi:peroxiredoxin